MGQGGAAAGGECRHRRLGSSRTKAAPTPKSILNWPPERSSLLILLQMMDYNVPLGKLNRGMAVLDVVRSAGGCCWAMV